MLACIDCIRPVQYAVWSADPDAGRRASRCGCLDSDRRWTVSGNPRTHAVHEKLGQSQPKLRQNGSLLRLTVTRLWFKMFADAVIPKGSLTSFSMKLQMGTTPWSGSLASRGPMDGSA